MIEELMQWEVKNDKLIRLGKKVEEINKEFGLVCESLIDAMEENGVLIPNKKRAYALKKKIEYFRSQSSRIILRDKFHKLVLNEYRENMYAQHSFIRFFFERNFTRDFGIEGFLNDVFTPEERWHKNSAVHLLERMLGNMNYDAQSKREDLMCNIETRRVNCENAVILEKIDKEIPKLKRAIRKFNLEKKFVNPEQAKLLSKTDRIKQVKEKASQLERTFSAKIKNIPLDIVKIVLRKDRNLLNKDIELGGLVKSLVFDLFLEPSIDYSAYWDTANRDMGVSPFEMFFYRDKDEKIRLYLGDMYITLGHENAHRMQDYFSQRMPLGIRTNPNGLSLTAMTVAEGIGIEIGEKHMLKFMKNNKKYLNLSDKDITRAELCYKLYLNPKLVKVVHSVYHWKEDVEEHIISEENKKNGYDEYISEFSAHKRLAKTSKNWAFFHGYYLNDDPIVKTFDENYYIFGRKYLRETLSELKKRKLKSLRSEYKVRKWFKENEPVILQGLLTGMWGWSTHKEFLLDHYLPKAKKIGALK